MTPGRWTRDGFEVEIDYSAVQISILLWGGRSFQDAQHEAQARILREKIKEFLDANLAAILDGGVPGSAIPPMLMTDAALRRADSAMNHPLTTAEIEEIRARAVLEERARILRLLAKEQPIPKLITAIVEGKEP